MQTLSTVVAVLLTIPLFMMGVVMPLLALAKGGEMMGGAGGLQMLLPLIPLTILGTLAYSLYRYGDSSDDPTQQTANPLEELRTAYARGDLSDEEFETRRDRLHSHERVDDGIRGFQA